MSVPLVSLSGGAPVYTGVGTTLLTYTAPATGTYLLTGYVTVNTTAVDAGGEEGALTLKNGSTTIGIFSLYTSVYPMCGQVSQVLSLTSGDVVTLHGEYYSGVGVKPFSGTFKMMKF